MSAVRSVYRELFRATRVAFGEDLRMLTAARSQITQGFRQDQTAQLSEDELQQKLQHAKDVGLFLRRNIVQGKKNEENDAYGKYTVWHCSIDGTNMNSNI